MISDEQLAPQDSLGALSVGELNSPRVAPLHRFSSILIPLSQLLTPNSRFPTPSVRFPH
ncbi:hypothetical protein [Moorena sp. SIO3B2]|uniref:hypothetical protein n=1 Tax=Moorena sp. SIO3B2 TaxID=2607827 RepID=UPI0013CC9BF1|nr:hypothetical protein [Moorena sp. SIO3B2]NEP37420.1 hypothetical protein [Moorena sp. SIO3B2]